MTRRRSATSGEAVKKGGPIDKLPPITLKDAVPTPPTPEEKAAASEAL